MPMWQHNRKPSPPPHAVHKPVAVEVLAAALRIVATRLYDWLNPVEGALVRAKDPLEHLKILRFHQKVKSPADYGFKGAA